MFIGHRAAACLEINCSHRENWDKNQTTLLHLPATNCYKLPATEELVARGHDGGSNTNISSNVLLPRLPVNNRANDEHNAVEAYAFLDPNSIASCCTESLLSKFKVTGRDVQFMTTTISAKNQPTKTKLVQNLGNENDCTVSTQCFSV